MTKASEILRSDQKFLRPKILYVPSTSPSVIWLFAFLQIRSVWIIQLNLPVSKIVLLCKASQLSFLIGLFLSFRVYNLLVADIMKTNLFYISYHTKYADLKALLEKSNHRSYPLVDSEGTAIILRSSFMLILLSNRCFYWCLWVFDKTHNFLWWKHSVWLSIGEDVLVFEIKMFALSLGRFIMLHLLQWGRHFYSELTVHPSKEPKCL